MRHHRHCFAQDAILFTCRQILDEHLVDFDIIDVEFLQISQRGITRSEIIKCHFDTGVTQGKELIAGMFVDIQQKSFRYLDDNRFRRQIQAFQMGEPDIRIDPFILELDRRNIDADLKIRHILSPF